ncbi:zinc finger MYM-type protein 5-like [Scomber scombrus]|uniref:Zinc finger MYM-type protein 5-like n=1 Tax=Scomber scombrus TaxID=13677 RepID=A0AAV1QB50_SCOSC
MPKASGSEYANVVATTSITHTDTVAEPSRLQQQQDGIVGTEDDHEVREFALEEEVPLTPDEEYCSDSEVSAHLVDLSDPSNWPVHLDTKTVDLLVEKGPFKVSNFDFPVNQEKRHFSDDFYVRKLPNGEKARRDWLVYSKKTDSVFCFCFCCKQQQYKPAQIN